MNRGKAPGPPTAHRVVGEGPPLVLVPGLDGTALLFYRQIPLLSQVFRVITFPLPDDSESTMESLIADLHRLGELVAPGERLFLCGESFGGALSLSFALAHPERIAGLVIINSFPVIRQRWRLRLAPHLLRAVPWGAMALVRRFTEFKIHSPHTRREDLDEFHRLTQFVGKRSYIRRLEILKTYDIRERLGEIQVPALFLAGDRDQLVPSVREARFMAARMPRARVKVLEGFGHICLITHDLNLLQQIEPWLAELEPVGR